MFVSEEMMQMFLKGVVAQVRGETTPADSQGMMDKLEAENRDEEFLVEVTRMAARWAYTRRRARDGEARDVFPFDKAVSQADLTLADVDEHVDIVGKMPQPQP